MQVIPWLQELLKIQCNPKPKCSLQLPPSSCVEYFRPAKWTYKNISIGELKLLCSFECTGALHSRIQLLTPEENELSVN